MKVDIEPKVGDQFYYLKNGSIFPAFISKVEIMDLLTNFDRFTLGSEMQVERRTTFGIRYNIAKENSEPSWQSDNTSNSAIFHKTKQDAAREFLVQAGLEPGLADIE